jgi:hypothetical protein
MTVEMTNTTNTIIGCQAEDGKYEKEYFCAS